MPPFLTLLGVASDPKRLRPLRVPPFAEILRSLGVCSAGDAPTEEARLTPAVVRCWFGDLGVRGVTVPLAFEMLPVLPPLAWRLVEVVRVRVVVLPLVPEP